MLSIDECGVVGGVGAGMAHKVSSVAESESVVVCCSENASVVA